MVSRILVIEDDVNIRSNIVELLDAEDFETFSAENGFEGIQLVQDCHPNLILCDVMMPELDGYDVLNMLQKDSETAKIPFVFLTAKTSMKDIRQGMNLGADDYLTKPFTRIELLQTISSRLSRQIVFEKYTDSQIMGLRQSITYSIPDKILDPLDEISKTSEIFIQDNNTLEPQETKNLGLSIHTHARFLHRAVQNFFLYMNLEFLVRDSESLDIIKNAYTLRPGDFIFMIAMQKAKKYERSKDLTIKTINAHLLIATDDLKKVIEESLDFALSFSEKNTPVTIGTNLEKDFFKYSIQCYVENLSATQHQCISQNGSFSQQFYEELDPGLGLLIIHRIAEIYDGKLTLKSEPDSKFSIIVSLPIKPSAH